MNITEKEALSVVSLATMRSELRVPDDSHDALISRQIHDAANYVSQATGAALADLPPLRPAIISFCRELYNGTRELPPNSSGFALMDVYRSYAPEE